jgi:HK97 family phage prohead protease
MTDIAIEAPPIETDTLVETRVVDTDLEFRKRKAEQAKGTIEHRQFVAHDLEVRTLDDGTIRMRGYGSVTEHDYEVGPFVENMRRGSFKRTLGEDPDVILLFGHEGMPLARSKFAGTLAMEENSNGLHWTADLDGEDPDSRVLARKVERGLITECSIAFQVTDQEWSEDYKHRSIKSVSLHRGDISLVSRGANDATSVAVQRGEVIGALQEVRAGKSLSAATMETLTQVLNLVATADEAVDEAQPMLAELMGVPNPDEPEPDAPEAEDASQQNAYVMPDYTTRALERVAILRAGGR